MGPSFEDKLSLTSDIILLEVGGGSSGMDLVGLQLKFKEKGYSVCTYDRAGYGKSEQGGNPSNVLNTTMFQMT